MTTQPSSQPSDFEAVRCLSLPLADKLDAYHDRLKLNLPRVAAAYQEMVDRLTAADAGAGAINVGDQLPPFLLPDETSRLVDSQTLLSSGPLVISFNRGHWCSFCRFELLALNDIYPDIKACGAEIVSVTPQRASYMKQMRKAWNIQFSFLSDLDNKYAIANSLVVPVGETMSSLYEALGIDLAEFQASSGKFLPIPATYVVARSGTVVAAHTQPDFRKRMQPDKIMQALRSI